MSNELYIGEYHEQIFKPLQQQLAEIAIGENIILGEN